MNLKPAVFRWLFAALFFFSARTCFSGEVAVYQFGVLNQQSATKTAELWNPILKYLGEVTGLQLQLKMGATVAETDAMMERGEFDFVFTNHNFRKEYDGTYRVLARWAGAPIYGVIAVPVESPVKALRDLAGKRVAFPSKEAFAAYAVPMAVLHAARVEIQPVFAGNQEGVLAQLRAKQVDAVAVNSRYLTQYSALNGLRTTSIFTSEGYAELPVLVHPRIPKAEMEAMQKALLGLRGDPRAAALLGKNGFAGFEAATEKDYDNVRKIYRKSVE